MVDWSVARRVAAFAARSDATVDPGVDLDSLSAEFVPRVSEYTALTPSEAVPAPEVVSRQGWAEANLDALAEMLRPVEDRMGDRFAKTGPLAGPLRAGAGAALAAELGLVTGYMSQRVLGQYELSLIAATASPRLLFVGANLVGVARTLDVDREAFVRWVTVHELTHAMQFGGVPWLRGHVGGMLREYLETVDLKLDGGDGAGASEAGNGAAGAAADEAGNGPGAAVDEAGQGAGPAAGDTPDPARGDADAGGADAHASGDRSGANADHDSFRWPGGRSGGLLGAAIDKLRALDLPDPNELADRFRDGGVAALVQTDEQRELMERMQASMAVIEGHAEHVMDALAPDLVPQYEGLRTAMDERRASRSAPERLLLRLLGLEMKMRQYKLGKEFCDAVVDEAGIAGLNRAWAEPAALPTLAELEDPRGWLARVESTKGRLAAG